MKIEQIIAGFDGNETLGGFTGIGYAEADARTRAAVHAMRQDLAEARREAEARKTIVEIPAHAISGTNGGDIYRVHPDGRVERIFETFPEVESRFSSIPCGGGEEKLAPLEQARPVYLRCAYNGLWSPSGTNWQPVRCLELTPEEAGRAGLTPSTHGGLLVLCRERYDSILGDVACICGIRQDSHAEDIDLGIWHLCAEQTARFHGAALQTRWIAAGERETVVRAALESLARRRMRLSERGRQAAEALAESLNAGRHAPKFFLELRLSRPLQFDPAAPAGLRRSEFDRLVEARSTQRVCSAAKLEASELAILWQRALPLLGEDAKAALDLAIFPHDHPMVASVGRAMHRAVEGDGGRAGLIGAACADNLRQYLASRPELPEDVRAWVARPGDDADVSLPASLIPPHLAAKLCDGGQFEARDGFFQDRRGRKLTADRLMKLVRLIARSFGKYFLSFQNTHPLLGILRYPDGLDEKARRDIFVAGGRAVAAMTFLARARGLVSIIKSGPVELARDDLRALAAEFTPPPPGAPSPWPLLTFQLGRPLGPDDRVCAGQPDEHDGLAERMLDRRAPRARLADHYLPSV